jgi:isopentenyl-diphosphate delta-isomerase
MATQELILVDELDQPIGTMDKMEAHEKGLLHRAFSVFIFNTRGHMLLQRRSAEKYHSPGLWTNACCSHPYPNEDVAAAAQRRLNEELGFKIPLQELFAFTYRSQFDNGLIEHEFDHVFAGIYDGTINANEAEVSDYGYRSIPDIGRALNSEPERFTPWFRIAFPRIEAWAATSFGTAIQ